MKNIIRKISWSIKGKSLSTQKIDVAREKRYPDLQNMKSCLIIWACNPEEVKWVKKIEDIFSPHILDKICVVGNENDRESKWQDIVYVNNEHVDMRGQINDEKLNYFLGRDYDLLLDLNRVPDILSDYLVRNSQANCKMSALKDTADIDIMIDDTEDELDFIEKAKSVLEKFKGYE
ncbi:MAG: hypothetical protein LBM07_05465 [Culturomica sp.]|jgi:hypothetical protein|nr:hypothetical protein [Culturomica sp.]